MEYRGRAWKYGDNINTDIISPPAFMELSIGEAAAHAMSPVDPEFAGGCREGDIFVAEENLGSGSSRETAPLTLKALGIRCMIAKSYARIFYRNCMNLGILVVECPDTDRIGMGDEIEVDVAKNRIINYTKKEEYGFQPVPEHIMELIRAGGLYPYLAKTLGKEGISGKR